MQKLKKYGQSFFRPLIFFCLVLLAAGNLFAKNVPKKNSLQESFSAESQSSGKKPLAEKRASAKSQSVGQKNSSRQKKFSSYQEYNEVFGKVQEQWQNNLPEIYFKICGRWETENQDARLSLYRNRIYFSSDSDFGEAYHINGIYEADENKIIAVAMHPSYSGSKPLQTGALRYEIPFELLNGEESIIIKIAGKTFTMNKVMYIQPNVHILTALDGSWTRKCTNFSTPDDINISAIFKGSTMLVSLEGKSFFAEFLCDVFYSGDKLYFACYDSSVSQIFDFEGAEKFFGEIPFYMYEDDEIPNGGADYFQSAFAYAHSFMIPESIFLDAVYGTPYEKIIEYKLKGKSLILSSNFGKIILQKDDKM